MRDGARKSSRFSEEVLFSRAGSTRVRSASSEATPAAAKPGDGFDLRIKIVAFERQQSIGSSHLDPAQLPCTLPANLSFAI